MPSFGKKNLKMVIDISVHSKKNVAYYLKCASVTFLPSQFPIFDEMFMVCMLMHFFLADNRVVENEANEENEGK